MKEWWINLSLREKQSLSLGIAAVILSLIYTLIWSPLSNKVMSLRNQVQHDQQLLNWMKETNKQIQEAEKNLKPKTSTPSGTSLLTVVQHQINKTPLVSGLTQLRQADNDSVELNFNSVDFDKLIGWLTQLYQQQGISISQMTVMASSTPGLVAAELLLKRS